MSKLLIDIGNSSVKWSILMGDALGPMRRKRHVGRTETVLDSLVECVDDSIEHIAVANVAGSAVADYLTARAAAKGAPMPWFATSRALSCGVRNAYRTPSQLGVDRWAALVAAYVSSREAKDARPICVVDSGTAMTFDVVTGDGQHLGGLILSGPDALAAGLYRNTADIPMTETTSEWPGPGVQVLGKDTVTAISNAAWLAVAATVDRASAAVALDIEAPRLLLSGGNAEQLQPWLETESEIHPLLVLQGLELLHASRDDI